MHILEGEKGLVPGEGMGCDEMVPWLSLGGSFWPEAAWLCVGTMKPDEVVVKAGTKTGGETLVPQVKVHDKESPTAPSIGQPT